jgi:hypothetical protein
MLKMFSDYNFIFVTQLAISKNFYVIMLGLKSFTILKKF